MGVILTKWDHGGDLNEVGSWGCKKLKGAWWQMSAMQRHVLNDEELSCHGRFRKLGEPGTISPEEIVRKFAKFPESFKIIDIGSNRFTWLKFPELSEGLEQFYCEDCRFDKFPDLPESLLALNCMHSVTDPVERIKMPRGLRELHCNHVPDDWPPCLEVLDYGGSAPLNTDNLPRGLVVLIHKADRPATKFNKLGALFPNLIHLEIDWEGYFKLDDLPASLIYFSINGGVTGLPKLPEGLEVLEIGSRCRITKLRDLPETLKILDVSFSIIRSVDKLPGSLIKFDCHFSEIQELPRVSDRLEIFIARQTGLSGRLELPGTIRYLDCGTTNIDEIVWRGAPDEVVPPIEVFICRHTNLARVPPLPKVMREIDVSGCKLKGAWSGYFVFVDEFNCHSNNLTELPDVVCSRKIFCGGNKLRYLPGGLFRGILNGCNELPGVADPPVYERMASLLELGGAAVLRHGLVGRVEVAELREYLAGFRNCPSCWRPAVLRRYFYGKKGEYSKMRCWRCRHELSWVKGEASGEDAVPKHRDEYLSRYTMFAVHRKKNKRESGESRLKVWFDRPGDDLDEL
jgi:hypothetical protein